MKKVYIYTLGCKVNQYETQALKEKFVAAGYEIAKSEDDIADVYVVNTCTVTGLSDRKSRQFIRRAKKQNPNCITAVIGCYAQVSPEEAKNIEGVNIVAGTNEKNHLIDYIAQYEKDHMQINAVRNLSDLKEYEELGVIESMESRTRAFIKIQEGCNRFCSYCIIPYARGQVRSRKPQDIVLEAETLIKKGYNEIVLTGINTALYGSEHGSLGLDEMIGMLDSLAGDFRIRLSSLEPTVIDKDYAKLLFKHKKLCAHIHLSVQSGSDTTLKNMNRSYNRDQYKEIVKNFMDFDGGYAITTDIIVGFPKESEDDFEDSLKLVNEIDFCKVHVFRYSKREGTKAAAMDGQISPQVKASRSERLIHAADESAKRFYEKNLGSVREVLFEEYDENTGLINGLSDNYIKVYTKGNERMLNQFAQVRLLREFEDGVYGEGGQ